MLRTCLLLLVLLAAPVQAQWSAFGSWEPDTVQDVNDAMMWMEPHTDPHDFSRRVYFNAILTPYEVPVNPNAAILQSRLLPPGLLSPMAIFGVWKDCNDDGYVGLAESALLEYRSELLLDDTICPNNSFHNQDLWVQEFRWIGSARNAANPAGEAAGLIPFESAMVWGDRGLPGDPVGAACTANAPPGTFSSTGAMVAWLDCRGNGPIAATVNGVDGELGLGLAFEDPARPQCSTSLLNQGVRLFDDNADCPSNEPGLLQRNSGESSVTVFDCEDGFELFVPEDDPVYAPAPSLAVNNPNGSYYDALGAAEAATKRDCGGQGEDSSLDPFYGSVNPEDSVRSSLEKRETTFAFEFSNGRSGSILGRTPLVEPVPANAGISALNLLGPEDTGPGWWSRSTQAAPFVVRDDLQGLAPVYFTFYAYISPRDPVASEYILPLGDQVNIYGAQWCEDGLHGVSRGFDCEPEHWWNPEFGASPMPTSRWSGKPLGAIVGMPYNLRDVDCFDNAVAAATVLDGVAPVTGRCPKALE